MLFSVLGPLEVREAGEPLPLGGPRQRSVLALLLLQAGSIVASDRLLTEIWGDDPPDGARDSLYTYVSNLRRVLGRDRIVRTDGGYRLEIGGDDEVDAVAAEADLRHARRLVASDPDGAISVLDRSLSGWRGRPYEGLEDLPAVVPEVARLDELRLGALEDRLEAELRAGGTPEVGAVEVLTNDYPYRERFWEILARSLYRAGRQAEALRALTRLREILAEELGIDPSPSVGRLEERILLQDPVLDAGGAVPTNLPSPISSFVGREEELADVERLVAEHRLVTVVGPGGAGKTRLAVEAARRIVAGFPDGVWLVDLGRVGAAEDLVPTVAAVLGPTAGLVGDGAETLVTRLRAQTTLLVIDNCEHLVEDVGRLAARLLSGAPALRVLATSRRPLGKTGEVLYALGGLATASTGEHGGDAERLFAARASAVRPGWELDGDADADTDVSSICAHLDGLPLAIELAAARVDTLSPAEIDLHLQDRFRFLDDPNADRSVHRSLLASLAWSYDLLDAADRTAFDLLGVFEGPFSSAACADVIDVAFPAAVGDTLRRLVGASLVAVVPGSPVRYRLLETMRLFARKHLRDTGMWADVVSRHAHHYRDRCRELREPVFRSGRIEARVEVEAELAEFEAAFDRFVERGDVAAALDMAWPMGHVWLFSGLLGNGIMRLERLIDSSSGDVGRGRADALTAAAFLFMYVQRYEEASTWAEEAARIYRALGDERGLAYALARRGHLAFSVGDVPAALQLLQETLEICARLDYAEGSAWPLALLAQARLWAGDESDEVREMLEEGRRRFIEVGDTYGQMHANMFIPNVGDSSIDDQLRYAEESVELAGRPGADPLMRPVALHNLAFSLWFAGERQRAVGLNRISARSALEMGVTVSSGMAFLQAALFAGVGGDPERAAVLYGAGNRFFVMQLAPFYERQLRPGIDAARGALEDERYTACHERGRAMSVEEATAFLLKE